MNKNVFLVLIVTLVPWFQNIMEFHGVKEIGALEHILKE